MSIQMKTLVALAALYVAVVALAYLLQRKLMYFPDPHRVAPAAVGLRDVEERVLQTKDGNQVVAWYGKARPGEPTLLYFHGNAGNLELRSERVRKYHAMGRGIFMLAYRGYGGSTGSPTEAANVADALLAYDTLTGEGIAAGDIIVYGESLGSGVAVQVAAARPVGGVILDAPYTSTVDVAAQVYPFLPVRWLMSDRYETLRYLPKVRAPLLVVHGELDPVIPIAMGRKVAAAAPGPAEIITFPKAGHDDHYLHGSYAAIGAWIDRIRSRPQSPIH